MAELGQILVVDDRILECDLPARFRFRLQQIPLGADRRAHRGDLFLADRVERRIRHLREQLLEIVEQQARPVRQDRQRGIGPHRADGLLAVHRHRRQQDTQIFLRIAECLLPRDDRFVVRFLDAPRRQILDIDQVLPEPFAVRMLGRQLTLDLLVVDDAPLGGVHEEDLPGVEALLDENVLRWNVEHADLRRHDHHVVLGHVIPRRPQAIAVEHGTDDRAVGEGNRRRAIPRFHQRRVVLVERLAFLIHRLVVAPRLGDHHQDRVRQRTSRHDEQFEHVVEGRRIAATLADDGEHLLQILAEHITLEQSLAGAHPVDVAAQGVDFTVVGDEPVRVRERPRRERVGAESLVDQRKARLQIRIGQVGKHRSELIRFQHPLVDQGLGRQADDVEEAS